MQKNNRKIAYIDFDGTLVKSNCIHYLELIQSYLMRPVVYRLWQTFIRLQAPIFYLLNKYSAEKFDRYYYRLFKGISASQLDGAVKFCVMDFLHSRYLPDAESQVQKLRAEGYRIVVVSGSLKGIVEPFARSIGADDCLATELETEQGIFTGRICGKSVNHHNKLAAIKAYQAENQFDPQQVIAIGNSKWDIPMLALADEAYTVNPDKTLARWAVTHGAKLRTWSLEKIPFRFYFLYLFLRPFIRRVEGLQYIPRNQGAIIIANHCSYLDHYLIGLSVMCKYGRRVRFLAKKEHFEKPFERWVHEWLGAFPIDRSKASKDSLLNVVKLLNNKELVLIYPEGTRSLDGTLQEFKPGVLFTQQKSGCDIIPAGIQGAFEVLPSGKLFPRLAKMSLRFGAKARFPEYADSLSRAELRKARLNILHDEVKRLSQADEVQGELSLQAIYSWIQL